MIVPRDADPGLRVCSDAWADCLRDAASRQAWPT
jgi:hypothetical protein